MAKKHKPLTINEIYIIAVRIKSQKNISPFRKE